jgi:hypothetical protein
LSKFIDRSSVINSTQYINRVTAVWGFSEAAFGGLLHALHIPLTGLFVGGAAVIFITLISHYSQNKNQILKSTVTVILIKALISPHTPLTAYLAVALQGIFGYLLFSSIKIEKVAAFLLGIISLLYSALQKLIILTIVFGVNLWNSIDQFAAFIFLQFGLSKEFIPSNFSIILISFYAGLHVIGGFYFGISAAKIPVWVQNQQFSEHELNLFFIKENELFDKEKGRKKKWYNRPTGIFLILLSLVFMIVTYISPEFDNDGSFSILVMLLRAFLITFIWFSVLSPFLLKKFNQIIEKKKYEKASELNSITSLFPDFKTIINYCWKKNSHLKGIIRINNFFRCSLLILLSPEFKRHG